MPLFRSEAAPVTVIIDTREQEPYGFNPRLVTPVRRALPAGDYSVAGLEQTVAVERKTLDDFVGTVMRARGRFYRELRRLGALRPRVRRRRGRSGGRAGGPLSRRRSSPLGPRQRAGRSRSTSASPSSSAPTGKSPAGSSKAICCAPRRGGRIGKTRPEPGINNRSRCRSSGLPRRRQLLRRATPDGRRRVRPLCGEGVRSGERSCIAPRPLGGSPQVWPAVLGRLARRPGGTRSSRPGQLSGEPSGDHRDRTSEGQTDRGRIRPQVRPSHPREPEGRGGVAKVPMEAVDEPPGDLDCDQRGERRDDLSGFVSASLTFRSPRWWGSSGTTSCPCWRRIPTFSSARCRASGSSAWIRSPGAWARRRNSHHACRQGFGTPSSPPWRMGIAGSNTRTFSTGPTRCWFLTTSTAVS